MAVSAAGCSSTRSLSDVKNSGKLMMSTNAEFEPFEYKDGGEIVGIDIDISKKIAESLGVELEISDIAFDSLIPALQSGKADIVAAGMTADAERRESVDFSDPYFNALRQSSLRRTAISPARRIWQIRRLACSSAPQAISTARMKTAKASTPWRRFAATARAWKRFPI